MDELEPHALVAHSSALTRKRSSANSPSLRGLSCRWHDHDEMELRDHAEDILTAVVDDIPVLQTDGEQREKSQGRGAAKSIEASGRLHADDRIQHGFSFRAVLAEFRALRATVLRL